MAHPRLGRLVAVAVVFLVIGIVVGAIIGYALWKNPTVNQPPAQVIRVGDEYTHAITINGVFAGYTNSTFVSVTATQVTQTVNSTCWYYSSGTYTYHYWYDSGSFKMTNNVGTWVDSPGSFKTGETDISTIYGQKHVDVYSYQSSGATRTALAPAGCFIPYEYTSNDSGGNHVVGVLAYTNIEWLRNA